MSTNRRKKSFLILPLVGFIFVLFIVAMTQGFVIASEIILLLLAIVSSITALILGYSWEEIQNAIIDRIISVLPGILIMITVGILIGTWMIGGTIPMLVHYGLTFIPPDALLVASFILTSIVSVCTGTSWGSVGTVGVALIGVAYASEIPLAPAAGAIICGAHFGDKLSPLSDTTNLAAIASGANLYEHIAHMLRTTIPAYVISCIIFIFVGNTFSVSSLAFKEITLVTEALSAIFTRNILLWIPLIIVLLGSFFKKAPVPTMILSSLFAIINAVLIQNFALIDALTSMVTGFNIKYLPTIAQDILHSIPTMTSFFNRGGMQSMLPALLIMILAYSFAGALFATGALELLIEKMVSYIKGTRSLILITMLTAFLFGLISETYVAILLIGEIFRTMYTSMNLATQNLSRALEDSVTATQPFIPWTAAGVYMSTTLGVPTVEYLPWAVLTYTSLLFSSLSAITMWGIIPLKK
ncbi:MAG: Na+/H+ antiporter NhaC [Desulfovibrionaceae bacterium]